MSGTHHYYIDPTFNAKAFAKIAEDFVKMIVPLRQLGVVLVDENGDKSPTITPTKIAFNGSSNCEHKSHELGVRWPTKGTYEYMIASQKLTDIIDSSWFANIGQTLAPRICGGNCKGQGFSLEQELSEAYSQDEFEDGPPGKVLQIITTAFKPYDLAVKICFIIAKECLKGDIEIQSSEEASLWEDAKRLCQCFLGYGEDFEATSTDVQIGDKVKIDKEGDACPVCINPCQTTGENEDGFECNSGHLFEWDSKSESLIRGRDLGILLGKELVGIINHPAKALATQL